MWKIQLTIAANYICSRDNNEEHVMHLTVYNEEIKISWLGDEFMENLFESLLNRYQNKLEATRRGSDFIFDCVHVLYYKCHKINSNRGGSYRFS